ncbi:coatomer WD associated region-domain-containing protein [Rhizophagus diaphanus]|nr:coatomer WD associated region-domain-containing protein [Rhizophagus diaphanus] [Rhizophagus sp. MUCL 43196]
MGMRLEIKRKLFARSDRVKCVDFHPTEPWLLASLYNGNVYIWNYETQALVKTFEVTDVPVRAAKFIARKNWLITGSDDMQIRVFNYNTHEKVTTFEAHPDYIRCIAVHPTQPFVLTGSDDMTVKLWDWEKGWKNIQIFEGHTHYVMNINFNPKDSNTFASACLDRTIKVWSLGSAVANFTLEGHEKGVNWVEYYHGGEKPYLVSAADDKLVKIWDYQNKTCVQTLEGHTQNAAFACFHPGLPIIISGSEDGTVKIWHSNTYRLENTLNYGLERAWTIAYQKGNNNVAFGYDEGAVCVKLGREEPAVSMDNSGKIIWAKHNEIQTANIKAGHDDNIKDGDRLPLPVKDLGSCEIYPQTLQHSPNGRFVVVCGDGEYIIYTALAWRNKGFGNGLEFVWALDSNEYAVRESTTKIKLYKNFKERPNSLKLNFTAEGIYGGTLLGVKSSSFLNLYDWETCSVVRRIDVIPKSVHWSDIGDLVTIACEDTFYVLRFNRQAYTQFIESGGEVSDEGVEQAFEFVTEISESIKTGTWVGDCFIYTNAVNRLNYLVGAQTFTISHFDTNMYLLGYIPKDNRIYLADKDVNVYSYALSLTVIEYQTAILRNDLETAEQLLPTVPAEQRNRIARFLESQDLKELALEVSTDIEHKFELAVQLNKLDVAVEIAREADTEAKWKTVGDSALSDWKFSLAEECLKKAKDLSGLLLLYTSSGNAKGIRELAESAATDGKNNVAFACYLQLGQVEDCIEILIKTDRIPEAAMFARTYLPSQVSKIVKLWKENLEKQNKKKAAEALADPADYENLFPDFKHALIAEELSKKTRNISIPATSYAEYKDSLDQDIIAEIKEKYPDGVLPSNLSPLHNRLVNSIAAKKNVNGDMDDEVSVDDDRDNMSLLSMEVNTTGTGSVRGDVDFDDAASFATSEHERPGENLVSEEKEMEELVQS